MQSRVASRQRKLEQFYNEILLPMMGITAEVKILNYSPVSTPVVIDDKFWEILSPEAKIEFAKQNIPGFADLQSITPINAISQTAEQQVNDSLKNLTGRQLQGIQRIVRKFNKEELTFDQAKQLLKNGFGFTDADVDAWLITPEEA
jgi:hypothetical protein